MENLNYGYIGECLYLINKNAKKYRDLLNKVWSLLREWEEGEEKTIFSVDEIKLINNECSGSYENFSQSFEGCDGDKKIGLENLSNLLEEEKDCLEIIESEIACFENIDDEDKTEDDKSEYEDNLNLRHNIDLGIERLEQLHNQFQDMREDLIYFLREGKLTKEADYELKQNVIEALDLHPIGGHMFPDGVSRPLYKIGNFTFHGEPNDITYNEPLDTISSEINISTNITYDEASKYLQNLVITFDEKSFNSIVIRQIGETKQYKKALDIEWTNYTGELIIKGDKDTPTTDTIWVENGVHDIILDNVNIDVSHIAYYKKAFYVNNYSNIVVTLVGTNKLKNGDFTFGLIKETKCKAQYVLKNGVETCFPIKNSEAQVDVRGFGNFYIEK